MLLGDLTMNWSDVIKREPTTMRSCSASTCEFYAYNGRSNCIQPAIDIGREGNCLQFKPRRINPKSGSGIREARR